MDERPGRDDDILEELKDNIIGDPDTEKEILLEVEELLGIPYKRAKTTHIWAEEQSGEHNWVAMTNFRDALDHMSKIFDKLENDNIREARENLGEMEAHIQRAAYDSAQSVPDKKIDEVYDKKMEQILYKITFLNAPRESEFQKKMDVVRDHMISGREKKAESMEESIRHFKTADDIVSSILSDLPSKREVKYRLIILTGAFISILSLSIAIVSLLSSFDLL